MPKTRVTVTSFLCLFLGACAAGPPAGRTVPAPPATVAPMSSSAPAAVGSSVPDALAAVWRRAEASGVLAARLFGTRYYRATRGVDRLVVSVSGSQEGKAVSLRVVFRSEAWKGQRAYGFTVVDGALTQVTYDDDFQVGRVQRDRANASTIAGRVVTTTARDHDERRVHEDPWPADALPRVFALFVLPNLADQGLRERVPLRLWLEGPKARLHPAALRWVRLSEAPEKHPVSPVHRYAFGSGWLQATLLVEAGGPRAGQLLEVQTTNLGRFERICAERGARFDAEAHMLQNEWAAFRALRELEAVQQYGAREGRLFTGDLEEASRRSGRLTDLVQELAGKYRVTLRAHPKGIRWMAVAAPVEPGKTGRYTLMLNSAGSTLYDPGTIYASGGGVPIGEHFAIPRGALPYLER